MDDFFQYWNVKLAPNNFQLVQTDLLPRSWIHLAITQAEETFLQITNVVFLSKLDLIPNILAEVHERPGFHLLLLLLFQILLILFICSPNFIVLRAFEDWDNRFFYLTCYWLLILMIKADRINKSNIFQNSWEKFSITNNCQELKGFR